MLTPIQRQHLELVRKNAGGVLRPRDVLADARGDNSPLHSLFQWNDAEAANSYRMQQAKEICRVVVRMSGQVHREPVRTVVSVSPSIPRPTPAPAAPVAEDPKVGEFRDALAALLRNYDDTPALDRTLYFIRRIIASQIGEAPPKREAGGALSRFKPYTHSEAKVDREAASLRPDHPALTEARTQFPSRVFPPNPDGSVLISGVNNSKIGGFITKGPWAGMSIYTLTLEERATCPTECHLWAECYGNAMHLAKRWENTDDLIPAIACDLVAKAGEHPAGFVVRLHVLGDFPSADYVNAWFEWLEQIPQLHVFGYTAHPRYSLMGQSIADLNENFPDRCSIRYSVAPDADPQPMQATTIWHKARGAIPEGTVCPASSSDTEACGTCGLCWHPAFAGKRVVFLGHGMDRTGGRTLPAIEAPKLALEAPKIAPVMDDWVSVPRDVVQGWARENKVIGTLAQVNDARRGFGLPAFKIDDFP